MGLGFYLGIIGVLFTIIGLILDFMHYSSSGFISKFSSKPKSVEQTKEYNTSLV